MNIVKRILLNDLTSVLVPLVVLFFVLVTTSNGFLSSYNITSLLEQITIFALIGLAQMLALSLGQFNLALGSIGCLSAISMGFFMQVMGLPVAIALLLGLIIAAVLGWIQGVLIARSGINPFIITLALLSVYYGLATGITQGKAYDKLPPTIQTINSMHFGPVPVVFLVALIVCALVYFLFRYMSI
ncbi:MAG: hypothetical protein ABI478_12920, partial [Propionivibrio sp.]